jgi:hypothetical protein
MDAGQLFGLIAIIVGTGFIVRALFLRQKNDAPFILFGGRPISYKLVSLSYKVVSPSNLVAVLFYSFLFLHIFINISLLVMSHGWLTVTINTITCFTPLVLIVVIAAQKIGKLTTDVFLFMEALNVVATLWILIEQITSG